NATDLAYFAKELFKEEIKADREKLFEYGKIDLKPYLEELKREQSGGGAAAVASSDSEDSPAKQESRVLDFGFEEQDETVPKLKAIRTQTKTSTSAVASEGTKKKDSS